MSWFGKGKAKKTNYRKLGLSKPAARWAKKTARKNGRKRS